MNKYSNRERWQTITASVTTYLLFVGMLLAIMCVLFSCSPKIIRETGTFIEYKDRVVHDTVTVEITKEVEKIVTRDTISHLENKYAKSDALVSGGLLSHSLESIPQTIYVPVEVHVTDTIKIEKQAETIVKEVKVEKSLTWWQKAKIGAFWWLLVVLAAALVYIFRKPILKLLKLLKLCIPF